MLLFKVLTLQTPKAIYLLINLLTISWGPVLFCLVVVLSWIEYIPVGGGLSLGAWGGQGTKKYSF